MRVDIIAGNSTGCVVEDNTIDGPVSLNTNSSLDLSRNHTICGPFGWLRDAVVKA